MALYWILRTRCEKKLFDRLWTRMKKTIELTIVRTLTVEVEGENMEECIDKAVEAARADVTTMYAKDYNLSAKDVTGANKYLLF